MRHRIPTMGDILDSRTGLKEVACKRCGDQKGPQIGLASLQSKTSGTAPLKRFT